MSKLSIYVIQKSNAFFKEIREYDDKYLEYEYYENEEIEVRERNLPLIFKTNRTGTLLLHLAIDNIPYNQQSFNRLSSRARNISNATPVKYKGEYLQEWKLSDLV